MADASAGEVRDPRLLVVAIAGRRHLSRPAGAQAAALDPVADLVGAGFRVVVVPGGREELAEGTPRGAPGAARPVPLYRRAAEVQGALGYRIQVALEGGGRLRGVPAPVASLPLRVVVDPADRAFARPTVPLGPVWTAAAARRLARAGGIALARAGRGYRRLYPSPGVVRVVEIEAVRRLVDGGGVVVTGAAGGIPVVEGPDGCLGVEAVVAPEATAEALASALRADRLGLLTDVPQVTIGFGTPRAIGVERLRAPEARALLAAGEFPPGSMGPKIEAAIRFVTGGGREACITTPAGLREALEGRGGTTIVA